MSNAFDEMLKKIQATSGSGGNLVFFKAPKMKAATDTGEFFRVATPSYVAAKTPPFFQYMQYDLRVLLGVTHTAVAPYYFGAPDPIADYREKCIQSGDPELIAIADALTPKMKWGCIGSIRTAPGKVAVWSNMPKTPLVTMLGIANKSQGDDAEYNWPFSLEDGHDFEVLLYGAPIPKYQINVSPKARPVAESKDLQEKINAFNIWDKILYIETKETLEGILEGRYDKDAAKAARAQRDERFGRPYPEEPYNFMSIWGDETPTVSSMKAAVPEPSKVKTPKAEPADEIPFDTPKAGAATKSIAARMEEMKKKAAAKKAGE